MPPCKPTFCVTHLQHSFVNVYSYGNYGLPVGHVLVITYKILVIVYFVTYTCTCIASTVTLVNDICARRSRDVCGLCSLHNVLAD